MIISWLVGLAGLAFLAANCPMRKLAEADHTTSAFYGAYAGSATIVGGTLAAVAWALISMLAVMPSWPLFIAMTAAAVASTWHARQLRFKKKRARYGFEKLSLFIITLAAVIAILTTVGIIASVAVESVHFFSQVPINDFLFGTLWSPQIAIREDQAGAGGAFGFLPLLSGTMLITVIAMTVATPIGIMSAIYLSEFASPKTRARIKPVLEMLAGVPTVVYGFFAVITLSPILRDLGESLGVTVAGESALAAGLVMGVMLIPFVASLSEDALFAVPESLRQGALGLGSTRFEMVIKVVTPAALPGIVAGILLAFSRAVGETMIVVMAAGASANMTANPLEAVTTITVQIVTLLTGDQEFDDPKTLAAFALGLTLFFATLILNMLALHVVRRYQERYD